MANVIPLYEVRQSNALTEARFNLSAVQLDLYFYLLTLLKVNDEPEKLYSIYVSEIEAMTGRKWNYQQLREATKDLLGKVIEWDDPQGNLCQTALISSAKYIKGSGCIKVTISYLIRPLLWDLKGRYTTFQLYCSLSMTSKFAKRLYMICSEWKNNIKTEDTAFSREYTLDELRDKLGLTDPTGKEPDQYKQWGQFKQFVLDTAKKQINQYSDLRINYKARKFGRSYELVQFTIQKNKNQQLLIDFSQEDIQLQLERTNRKVNLIDNFKLTEQQANTVVRRLEPSVVNKVLQAVVEAHKKNPLKNIGAYTVSAIKNEFGIEL